MTNQDFYVKLAQQVLHAVGSAVPDAQTQPLLQRLVEQAKQLIDAARSPITFGLAGEYSTGKSLAAGVLFDLPDLLPVSAARTTGNVTMIKLFPSSTAARPRVRAVTVELLDDEMLAKLGDYIVTRMVQTGQNYSLPINVSYLEGYNPVAEGWARFDSWHDGESQRLDVEAANDGLAGIRSCVRELLRLRRAIERGRGLPRSFPVEPSLLLQTVQHMPREATSVVHGLRLPLQPAELTEIFSLIARVVVEVEVSERQWLVGEQDQEYQALDFPGVGTAEGVRDDFLAELYLRDVHTIALIVNAKVPAGSVPQRFIQMLAGEGRSAETLADTVLVVANQFDLLSAPAIPSSARTVAELAAVSDEFGQVLKVGEELTGGRLDRLAFTSLFRAIDVHQMSTADPKVSQAVSGSQAAISSKMQAWAQAAAAIGRDDRAPLVLALESVAQDGGLAHLRRMISRHMAEHGLSLKAQLLERLARQLFGTVLTLDQLDPQGRPALDNPARAALAGLVKEMERVAGGAEAAVRRRRPGTSDAQAQRHLDAMLERLRVVVANEVFTWPRWEDTLTKVDAQSQIMTAEASAPTKVDDGDSWLYEDAAGPPITSTAQIRDEFKRFVDFGQTQARQLLVAYLDQWYAAEQSTLNEISAPATRLLSNASDLFAGDRDGGTRRPQVLMLLTDLHWVTGRLSLEAPSADRSSFPLSAAQRLPWHPGEGPRRPNTAANNYTGRHLMRVVRMRQEVTDAVLDLARQTIIDGLEQLAKVATAQIEEWKKVIPSARYINRAGPAAEDWRPSPWQQLLKDWRTL